MIIKSLKLENIRSYTNETVNFPLGTTLFEGDIGSGKSTILMAIEFALFGLGSEKAGALLRTGTAQGSVSLRFEVDGGENEVYRSLIRKGKNIQQGEGYIKTKEGVLHLSASEIKEKVLEILNFNEPSDPKAQSVIYRYAIFTPQEEMKAILWMRPDSRLQTLRKAFRIEDYRTAMDNASNLAKNIKDRSTELASQALDLEEKIKSKKEKEGEINTAENNLKQFMEDEKKFEGVLKENREEIAKLHEKKEGLGKAVGEIPLLSNQIKEKNNSISELREEVDMLSSEVNEVFQLEADKLGKIEKPTEKTEKMLKEELEGLRQLEKNLSKTETNIEAKIEDYESIEKNKICPTCDRPADPEEFREKVEQKVEEKKKASAEVKRCEEGIKKIEDLRDKLKEYAKAQEKLEGLNTQIKKNKVTIEKNNSKVQGLTEQVEEAQKKLNLAKRDVKEFNDISEKIEKLEKEKEKVEKDLEKVKNGISSSGTKILLLKKEVEELIIEVERKQGQRKEAERLKEYNIWLDGFFVPTVDNIEKHMMISINQEFNQQFQAWFNMLVEDSGKGARIDEDFTPIIEQDGYEQDIYYLSGGEKTSVALAYRLALNSIVQKVSIGMKSNLLILDEPTDGFSKEQLYKVRDILSEIKCPQVVIVSHEKELESFADQVLRVEKSEGISKVKTG